MARSAAPAGPTESYIALLELEPIRRAIGPDRWPQRRRRVQSVVRHVAQGMIGAADSLALHGDEACVITFGDTTREDAALAATAIGQRIVRSLFGEYGLERIVLTPRVVPLKDLAMRSDFPFLRDASRPSRPDAPRLETGVPSQPDESPRIDRQARRQRLIGLFSNDPSATVANRYVPVWNIDSKMVDRFLAVPGRRDAQPAAVNGYAALGPTPTDRARIAFDIDAIERGLLALKQAIDAGSDGALLLPLHFDTAGSNRGRAELMEIFPNLPAFVRGRLAFVLFGVPTGVPEGRLHAVIGALRRLVKEVVIALEPAAGNAPALAGMVARIRSAGAHGVAIAFPAARSDDALEGALAICARAVPLGLKVCALGLVGGRQAHRLAVAGCTEFGGSLFGRPFAKIPVPYRVHAKVFEQGD